MRAQLARELEDAAWALAAWHDLSPRPELATLSRALSWARWPRSRQAILLLLSFLHDPVAVLRARDGLAHGSREKRAYALEALRDPRPRDHKPAVLAFLEGHGARRWPRRGPAEAHPRGRRPSTRGVLEVAPSGRARSVSAWTTACAVQAVAWLGGATAGSDVLDRARRDEPRSSVRRPDLGAGHSADGSGGKREEAADVDDREGHLRSKAVPMFEDVSEEILADVAELMEEVDYKAGARSSSRRGGGRQPLHRGVRARARLRRERTIVELGEREMFGELALLDPEPRLASVASLEDRACSGSTASRSRS